MAYSVNSTQGAMQKFVDYAYLPLLTEEHGCLAGCRSGLLWYTQLEYRQGGVHSDQEGFFVLEGTGSAQVGDEEFALAPGVSFIAPPGCYHAIKRDQSCQHIKLFFFHAAV